MLAAEIPRRYDGSQWYDDKLIPVSATCMTSSFFLDFSVKLLR
ncbi:MAG: hypothetical protein ACEY3M_16740 [Wolbachia sp.]